VSFARTLPRDIPMLALSWWREACQNGGGEAIFPDDL
jgi:hypothetical protein